MQTSKRLLGGAALAFVLGLLQPAPASAVEIRFQTTNLGGDLWRYDYFATDGTLAANHGLTVFFALGLYEDLVTPASPAGWSTLAIQQDTVLLDDGFFDAKALSTLTPLDQQFSVSFVWRGPGTAPGAQPFDIYRETPGFEIIGSGETVPLSEPIPEPSTLLLLGAGAAGMLGRRRKPR